MERSNVHISLGKSYTHYHRVMSVWSFSNIAVIRKAE